MTSAQGTLTEEICSVVDRRWRDQKVPMLLSQLGGLLSPPAKIEFRLTGMPLRDYIGRYLSSRIRIVNMDRHGDGAVPAHEINTSDSELLKRYEEARLSRPINPYPRFYPGIWGAFSRPLSLARRFIDKNSVPGPTFRDLNESEDADENWIEVRRDQLPAVDGGTGFPHPAAIAEAIRKWATDAQLEIGSLYQPAQQAAQQGSTVLARSNRLDPKEARSTSGGLNTLLTFLEELEPHERARLSIPGDILLSILKRDR